jgi:hypothetical protein
MEIDFLWTFEKTWQLKLLVMMMIGQMLLTIWLYIQMAKARIKSVKEGLATREDFSVVTNEPAATAIYSRTLSNQFELPVLFFVIILSGIAVGVSSWITVVLAFLFVISRVVHAREMIGENRVMKRRGMFINTMRVFMLLLLELFISTIFFLEV